MDVVEERQVDAPSDGVCEVLGALAGLRTGILCSHVASVEYAVCELPRVTGNVLCPFWLTGDAARICDYLLICEWLKV